MNTEQLEFGIQYRRDIQIKNNSVFENDNERGFWGVLITETPVERYHPEIGQYLEVLSVQENELDLERVRNGVAPFLVDHDGYSESSHAGNLTDYRIENKELIVKINVSTHPDYDRIFHKIKENVRPALSAGYRIKKMKESSKPGDETRVFRSVMTEVFEGSSVSIPADYMSKVRSKQGNIKHICEVTMSKENQESNPSENSVPDMEDMKREIMQEIMNEIRAKTPESSAEKVEEKPKFSPETFAKENTERCQEIISTCKRLNLPSELQEKLLIDYTTPISEQRKQMIDAFNADQITPPRPASTEITRDERETMIEGATRSMMVRYGVKNIQHDDLSRNYSNMSLMDVAKDLLDINGQNTRNMSPDIILRNAQGLTAFQQLITGFAENTLLAGYQKDYETFDRFVVRRPIADFRTVRRNRASTAPDLQPVGQDGTVTRTPLADGIAEQYSLNSFSTAMTLSRQSIISDHLDAFTDSIWQFGQKTAKLENQLVYDILTSNPQMSDGNPLFSAPHGNVGSGVELNEDGLSAARLALRQQTDNQGDRLNLPMRLLIVGSALETTGEKFTYRDLAETSVAEVNPFKRTTQLIVDPSLDDQPALWFGATDRDIHPIIELGYLGGQEGPYIMTDTTILVDGISFRYGRDVAAKALEWNGIWASATPATPRSSRRSARKPSSDS